MKNLLLLVLSLISVQALANPACDTLLSKLGSTDLLAKIAEPIATEWRDGNITTGKSELSVGTLKFVPTDSKALTHLSEAAFVEGFKENVNDTMPDDAKLSTRVVKVGEKFIIDVASALSIGNDFDPRNIEGREGFKKDLETLLPALGEPGSLLAVITRTKLKDVTDEPRSMFSILVINKNDRKVISIFIVEGTM